ncbi:MAG: hypothetical protein K8S54_19575 [Spirochaetia bacterium]|nr:hypothetical protein [Spirochaetia bacterium]
MKHLLSITVFLLALAGLGAQTPAATQTTPAAAETATHDDAEDNYLDRQNALKGMESLRTDTQKDIRKLSVMVSNFGAEVAGSDGELKSIRDRYEESSIMYYRQMYVKARGKLDEVRVSVSALYKKFNDHYTQRTNAILVEAAKAVSGDELKVQPGSGNETEWSTDLIKNQSRLRTAYGHVAIAQDLTRDKRYGDAIDHYRLAKLFGIGLLKGMDEDPARSKAVDDKYRNDIGDASGIVRTGASTTPAATPTK